MKPFLVALAIFVMFMALVPFVFLARINIPEKADFSCFYAAGLLARTNSSHLYDAPTQMAVQNKVVGPQNGWAMFIQPPYEALLLAPFTFVSYRSAYLLYLLFNVALIIPCFLLARDAFSNVIDPWQPRPGLLFFFFLPLALAVLQGQGSVRLLLCCCAAWHELKRDRDFSAGLFLALALFKMQVIIPLALLLTIWRGRRLLGGFVLGTSVLGGIGILQVGTSGMWSFGKLLITSSLIKHESASEIASVGQLPSVMPNLRGLLYGCGGKYLPHLWLLGLTLFLSAALLTLIIGVLRRERDEATAFSLATIGALLLSYHLHSHDLTLLLLPIALLAGRTRPYFGTLVSLCFLLPVLLLVRLGQAHYLMAIPLIAFIFMIVWDNSPSFRDRILQVREAGSHKRQSVSVASGT